MALIDAVQISELQQTEVDSNTKSTTIHTALKLPDGGDGFIIIGRIVKDKKKVWLPLKDVIKSVYVEYEEKFNPIQTPRKEDSLLAE